MHPTVLQFVHLIAGCPLPLPHEGHGLL